MFGPFSPGEIIGAEMDLDPVVAGDFLVEFSSFGYLFSTQNGRMVRPERGVHTRIYTDSPAAMAISPSSDHAMQLVVDGKTGSCISSSIFGDWRLPESDRVVPWWYCL